MAQDSTYADFTVALRRTMKIEGGYVRAPRARGGQIYRGITRVSHPKWEGWKMVDRLKPQRGETFPELDSMAGIFYKERYWDYIRAGELTNQQTANSYFNTSVRLGLDRGIMRAQRSVGLPATGTVTDELIVRLNNRQMSLASPAKKHHKRHHPNKHHTSHTKHK